MTKEQAATNAGIRIRRASFKDSPEIADLLEAAFDEFRNRYTEAAFQATILSSALVAERVAQGPIWVAIDRNTIVGTISAVADNTGLYLRSMTVLPAARGRKLGEQLLSTVEGFARQQKFPAIYLSTAPFLKTAIALYQRCGFRRAIDGPHALLGTPLFTMQKNLLK